MNEKKAPRCITGLLFKKECVIISFSREAKNGLSIEVAEKHWETPRPELFRAARKIIPHIARICELGDEAAELIVFEGVKIEYSNDGEMRAEFTAKKKLMKTGKYLSLKTPKIKESSAGMYIDDDLRYQLDTLCDEAILYLDGERAQGSLFPPETEAEAAESAAGVH